MSAGRPDKYEGTLPSLGADDKQIRAGTPRFRSTFITIFSQSIVDYKHTSNCSATMSFDALINKAVEDGVVPGVVVLAKDKSGQ